MSNADTADGLREALGHFETCLQTPIVSGELAAWLADADQAFHSVGAKLRGDAQPRHATLLNKIASQDPELLSRVEELRATHAQLETAYDALHTKLGQLCDRAKAVEPDEGKLDTPVKAFITQGLEFVLAVRKQDTAVTTWYMEAFNRDGGVAG